MNALPNAFATPLLCLVMLAGTGAAVAQQTFYASPTGSGNTCSGSDPCSLTGVRDKVRSVNSAMTADITVILQSGDYFLASPLQLNGNDSGTNGHRVIWKAQTENQARFNGGQKVSGWQTAANGLWKTTLTGAESFRHLWVNDQPAVRARHPNVGKRYTIKGWDQDNRSIKINADEIAAWNNMDQVEIVIQKKWGESRFLIANYSTSGSEAVITPSAGQQATEWANVHPVRDDDQAYYFENARELLDQGGEWYFDAAASTLYYKPRAGESMGSVNAWLPQAEQLLRIDGANNLTFDGCVFEHTRWKHPSQNGLINNQAGFYRSQRSNGTVNQWTVMPSALEIKNAENVTFTNNIFRRHGRGAVELAYGTTNTQFVGNVFNDVAGNGVTVFTWLTDGKARPVGAWDTPVPEDKLCLDDQFVNNYFVRVGTTYRGAVPVVGYYPSGMVVDHNEIVQSPYSGISMGVGWTYNTSPLRDNKIRKNYVHQVMYSNCDGAGIYTLSKQPGTVISENFIENLIKSNYACTSPISAIYLDQASDGITVRDNVGKNVPVPPLVYEQTCCNGVGDNTISGNSGSNSAVEANAGLTAAYASIVNKVPAPNVPGVGNRVTAATDPPPGGGGSPTFPDPNKWYYLENKACPNGGQPERLDADNCTSLDVDPGSANDKQWRFERTPDGSSYFVINRACGARLDSDNCQTVDLSPTGSNDDKRWILSLSDDGVYYLLNNKACGGKNLDTDNCGSVKIAGGNQNDKRWKLVEAGGVNAREGATADKKEPENDVIEEELQLYPNPVRGRLQIRWPGQQASGEMVVHDVLGQEVLRRALEGGQQEVDMANLTPGLYTIKIQAGKVVETKKIVIAQP